MKTTKTVLSILLMVIYGVFAVTVCFTTAAAIVFIAYGNNLNQGINVNMDWWGIGMMFAITLGLLFLWGKIHTHIRKRTINIKPILSVSFMVIYELFLSGIAFITGRYMVFALIGKDYNINVSWYSVVVLFTSAIALYLSKEKLQKRIFLWGNTSSI